MKSEKAEKYLSENGLGYPYTGYVTEQVAERAIELAEQEAEEWVREELTRWNDPKEVLPKPHKDVLVKCPGGQIEIDFYSPKLGGFFIEHSTDAKVIGWREIH